jgi:hypothetical protein
MTAGQPEGRGYVLLLAAAPRQAKRRLVDPEAVMAALGAVPADVLADSAGPADLVQLVDPADPQAVLARLQAAARASGPVLVYVAGQLTRDRRGRRLHLALAETTPRTVRYTALPWHWIAEQLRARPAGTTTVLTDLTADADSWPQLRENPDELTAGLALFGTVAPPARRSTGEAARYTRALSALLRTSPDRSRLAELHALAAGQAQLAPDALVLAPPTAPQPVPQPRRQEPPAAAVLPPRRPQPREDELEDPRRRIGEALRARRYAEAQALADAWEREVLRGRGPLAREFADVTETMALVAAEAGQVERAVEQWMSTARQRLGWLPPHHPEVQRAVDNAHHLWARLPIGQRAADLGFGLVDIRHQVPGPGGDELAAAERRMKRIHDQLAHRPQP